jgi:apolipoprotein N-acyltransferase
VRSQLLGLPWILPALAVARQPLWIQTAELGGTGLVGFVLRASGAGLGLALAGGGLRPLAAGLAPLLLAGGFGLVRLAWPPAPGAGTAEVAVVQAAVPQAERFRPGSAALNTARHAALTERLLARAPADLVVWSETAVDEDLERTPGLAQGLARLAAVTGTPILTGAPRSFDGARWNAVVLVTPQGGVVESYEKQRLVPFSETDPPLAGPFGALLGPVTAGEGYAAGREATVFRAAGLPFAAPVCFEITDAALVRRFRHEGAAFLINLSNDAWFGPVGYPEMHLRHAILRAVELRSFVLRGANTGISAAIDPRGRVVREIDPFVEGTLRARVRAAGPAPLYARFGDGPLLAALAGLLLVLLRPWRG